MLKNKRENLENHVIFEFFRRKRFKNENLIEIVNIFSKFHEINYKNMKK